MPLQSTRIQTIGINILMILSAQAAATHTSFVLPTYRSISCGTPTGRRPQTSTKTTTYMIDPIKPPEDEPWEEGFNPFKRKTSSTPIPSILSSSTLSLRKIQMQELLNELLLNVFENDDSVLLQILSKNVELLMEPLEEEDAVGMDEDSIYEGGMTRDERFGRYESVMREREGRAVNGSVKRVLGVMREFVMARR